MAIIRQRLLIRHRVPPSTHVVVQLELLRGEQPPEPSSEQSAEMQDAVQQLALR